MELNRERKRRQTTNLLDHLAENKLITPKMRRITLFYKSLMRGTLAIMGAPTLKRSSLQRIDHGRGPWVNPQDRGDAVWTLHCWHHLCKLTNPRDRELLNFYAEALVSDPAPSARTHEHFSGLLKRLEGFYRHARKLKNEREIAP